MADKPQWVLDLIREVAESKSVTESAVAAFKGLTDKIAELSTSGLNEEALKAELGGLAAELDAQQKNLTDAITTGTVADPKAPEPDNGVETAPNHEPEVPPAEDVVKAAEETVVETPPAPPENI